MADHYTYRVTWSALSGIREMVNGVLVDMRAGGESPPAPLADRGCCGRGWGEY